MIVKTSCGKTKPGSSQIYTTDEKLLMESIRKIVRESVPNQLVLFTA